MVKYNNDGVENVQIAYIGGGSRGWARGLMSDLALEHNISGMVRLYDIDLQAAKHNEIIGNRFSELRAAKSQWIYKAVPTLKEALVSCDFVVISILPGTFDEMASDVHAPENYGIYQSVGDTVGPGGIIRSLRTIPMFVEIAEAIRDYCPEAWVINYTNPMTVCTKTLYAAFPKIKAFGCCHEVFGTQKLLTAALKDIEGIKDVKREEIKTNVLGVNHFTWLNYASYRGMDLFPIYKAFVDKYYETGYDEGDDDNWMNNHFKSAERVKFELFRRYGLIAAAGDRHLAEFMPGNWYLKDPETVKSWKFQLTTVDWRKKDLEEKIYLTKQMVEGEKDVQIEPTGEEGVRQIKALLGLEDLVTNVNLPNMGQMENVPQGAVVETNALFRFNQVIPIMSGSLPEDIHQLVIRHVHNQNITLKAALEKNKALAFRAFASDPLTTLPLEKAEELFQQMLEQTKSYLEGWEI